MENANYWYNLGKNTFGAITIAFFDWIVKRAKADKIDVVYFISREGYILNQLFQKYIETFPENQINFRYLPASRRAYNIASIKNLDKEDINYLTGLTYSITIRDFLLKIGLNPEDFKDTVLDYNFTSLDHLIDLQDDLKNLKKLVKDIKSQILDNIEEERNLLVEFLKQESVLKQNKIAVVDIGWHGSIQNSIAQLFSMQGINSKVYGYYICTFPQSEKYISEKVRMNGFLCHQGKPNKAFNIFLSCIELFEFAFSANLQPLERFQKIDDKIIPKYGEESFADIDSQRLKAEEIQNGIVDYIKARSNNEMSLNQIMLRLHSLLNNPTKEDLEEIGSLFHIDNFAGTPHKLFYIDKNRYTSIPLLNIVKQYNRSLWPYGYYLKNSIIHKLVLKLYFIFKNLRNKQNEE